MLFRSVLSAIQHFIEENDPEEIEFTAQKDTDSGEKNLSRSSLYTRLVKRYANSWGYRVDVSDNAGSTYYRLERIR